MIVCGCIYAFLGALWLVIFRKKHFGVEKRMLVKRMFLILVFTNTIAFVLFLQEAQEQRTAGTIQRNTYGHGSRKETYEITVGEQLEGEEITIDVEERKYTKNETRKIFQKVIKEIDQVVLGKNKSFDHVDRDLNLPTVWEKYPVQIRWELSSYEVMNVYGEIQQKHTKAEGTPIELRGYLTYENEEAMYVAHAMVYPRKKNKKEQAIAEVEELLEKVHRDTETEEQFELPQKVNGETIHWRKKTEGKGYYILGLGIVSAVLMIALQYQNKQKEEKERKKQMLIDYPEIVNKFALLLSAGMTTRAVWSRIVKNYEEQKQVIGERAAYEEMCNTMYEMQGGMSESQAYERFGKRCGIPVYMKLGVLLSQNLKKGTRGMAELLKNESMQAFENRKNRAKKYGEEAGTKLLAPMFVMLAVVLAMIMIPAFLSIRI